MIVPAVAVNVAVVAPEATVTDAGTVTDPLLLESETAAPPLGAPCDNVTVQVVVPPDARLDAVQVTELTTVWVTNEMLAVFELLL